MHVGDTLQREHRLLLTVCQKAYRKHHLGDDSIGWEELSDELGTALQEVMGDTFFQAWINGPWTVEEK